MKALLVVVSVILFVAGLVHSAAIDEPAAGTPSGGAVPPGPKPGPGGDLATAPTFWWPFWGGWGFGGGYGGWGGGWGGGFHGGYGGGWGPYY